MEWIEWMRNRWKEVEAHEYITEHVASVIMLLLFGLLCRIVVLFFARTKTTRRRRLAHVHLLENRPMRMQWRRMRYADWLSEWLYIVKALGCANWKGGKQSERPLPYWLYAVLYCQNRAAKATSRVKNKTKKNSALLTWHRVCSLSCDRVQKKGKRVCEQRTKTRNKQKKRKSSISSPALLLTPCNLLPPCLLTCCFLRGSLIS